MLEQQKFLYSPLIPLFTNERSSPFIDEEEALNHLQKPWVKSLNHDKIIFKCAHTINNDFLP
jgi:hypothetical protein